MPGRVGRQRFFIGILPCGHSPAGRGLGIHLAGTPSRFVRGAAGVCFVAGAHSAAQQYNMKSRPLQVESYIFVGDYCLSNPYPNECILRMRGLHNKNVVRGNEEKYLEN